MNITIREPESGPRSIWQDKTRQDVYMTNVHVNTWVGEGGGWDGSDILAIWLNSKLILGRKEDTISNQTREHPDPQARPRDLYPTSMKSNCIHVHEW